MWDDELRRLAARFQAMGDQIRPFLEEEKRKISTLTAGLEGAARRVQVDVARMHEQFAPIFDQMQRAFEALPPRNREALRKLAAHGWYLDPELPVPALYELAGRIDKGEIEQVHAALCDHFDTRLTEIEADVSRRFPDRGRFIEAALRAHRRGDYCLSIPVLLAQADGICVDLVGAQLYARRDGAPALATNVVVEDASPYLASLLCPLTEVTPLTFNQRERAGIADLLNRHAVLHGESVDYDTRLNSARAISLLTFVAWILERDSEEAA